MKILVTGGKGMLGRTLCKNWLEHEMICADLPEADITDREKFTELVAAVRPDTVIHCAAMTAVDRCETEIQSDHQPSVYGYHTPLQS